MKKRYLTPTMTIVRMIGESCILQFSGTRNGYDDDETGGFFEMESVNNEIFFPIP